MPSDVGHAAGVEGGRWRLVYWRRGRLEVLIMVALSHDGRRHCVTAGVVGAPGSRCRSVARVAAGSFASTSRFLRF